MSSSSIKQLTLNKLRNHWGTMIIGLLIYSAVNYLATKYQKEIAKVKKFIKITFNQFCYR